MRHNISTSCLEEAECSETSPLNFPRLVRVKDVKREISEYLHWSISVGKIHSAAALIGEAYSLLPPYLQTLI